jgi:polyisoprenoid-binding protein YceI
MKRLSLALLAVVLGTTLASATSYTIDANHSSVAFSIRHVVGRVIGQFNKFSGSFEYDDGHPQTWKADATIDAASIGTGIEKRDNHLRTADFFDVAKYPTISFKSTGVTDVQGNKGKLHGDLTMHGVTKPVVLDLEINGVAKDPMGKGTRAGATATGEVMRADFGIGATTGPMGSMVGPDVKIRIEIEGVSK